MCRKIEKMKIFNECSFVPNLGEGKSLKLKNHGTRVADRGPVATGPHRSGPVPLDRTGGVTGPPVRFVVITNRPIGGIT